MGGITEKLGAGWQSQPVPSFSGSHSAGQAITKSKQVIRIIKLTIE
jgi:hypothetical protein